MLQSSLLALAQTILSPVFWKSVKPTVKTFLLTVDLLLACAIVLVVLIQRGDSGGALGIGGGGGGLFSARGKANFLTRTTAILAALFFATSLSLAYLSKQDRPSSIIEGIEREANEGGTQNDSAEPNADPSAEPPQDDVPLAQ